MATFYPMNKERALFEYNLKREYSSYLDSIIDDIHKFNPRFFADFKSQSIQKCIDNSMIDDNILYLDTDKEGNNYYIDCDSGITYICIDNEYHVAFYGNNSSQFDIFDASYFRKYIIDPTFRKQMLVLTGNSNFREILSIDYLGTKLEDVFGVPILNYTVSSKKELEELIDNIHYILSESKFFKKLWFRGQRKEYFVKRSEKVIDKLGIAKEFCEIPSLAPSANRCITKENYDRISMQNVYWNMAYKVWRLSESNEFGKVFSIGQPLYNEIIKSILPEKMAQFVYNSSYDIYDYLIPNYGIEKSSILTTQQYGGVSTMLDITDDLDVALFFTQSRLNLNQKRYELCNAQKDNVLYLFAEARNTSTVNLSDNVFFSVNGKKSIPKRIQNQKCGLLIGANTLSYNTYAYRLIAKIKLHCSDAQTTKTVEEMFPNIEEDTLYRIFCDAEPKLEGLYG